MPKKSMPTSSARTPCSTTLRIVWAWDCGRLSESWFRSPKVLSPNSSGNGMSGSLCELDLGGGHSPGVHRRAGDGVLEVGAIEDNPEHRAARLQSPPGDEASHAYGVVAEAGDKLG